MRRTCPSSHSTSRTPGPRSDARSRPGRVTIGALVSRSAGGRPIARRRVCTVASGTVAGWSSPSNHSRWIPQSSGGGDPPGLVVIPRSCLAGCRCPIGGGLEYSGERGGQQPEQLVLRDLLVDHPGEHGLLHHRGPPVREESHRRSVSEAVLAQALEDPVGERGPCLGIDVAQELVTARRPADQGDVWLVVRPHVVDVRLKGDGQPDDRFEVLVGCGDRHDLVGDATYDGTVELLLVSEVVVEQAPRDPGLLGEHVDRQVVEPSGAEQLHAEVEQLFASGVRTEPDASCAHVTYLIELVSIRLLTRVQYRRYVSSHEHNHTSRAHQRLRRRSRVRRARPRDQARRTWRGRLRRGGPRGRGRRNLARQHLPRGRLRRPLPALLVLVRTEPALVALLLPRLRDPGPVSYTHLTLPTIYSV